MGCISPPTSQIGAPLQQVVEWHAFANQQHRVLLDHLCRQVQRSLDAAEGIQLLEENFFRYSGQILTSWWLNQPI